MQRIPGDFESSIHTHEYYLEHICHGDQLRIFFSSSSSLFLKKNKKSELYSQYISILIIRTVD